MAIKRLALALPTFLVAFAPAAARAPAPARPALWKLADADTTIWLFGTIHLLPKQTAWRDAAIDAAMGKSQSLMLEVVLDEDPGRVGRALLSLGQAPGLPPLVERVPPNRRASLARLIAASGMPAERLQGFKSWAAAILLTGPSLRASKVDVARGGVETQLTRLFRAAGKPIDGLETPEQQLGYFDALPEAAQRAFLAETVDDPARTARDFQTMLKAWSTGDVRAIERAFAEDAEFTPALRALLVARRDQLWADALAKRLKMPGTLFVAVGAGHLAGADSVQAMLAKKGLKVVRVQ